MSILDNQTSVVGSILNFVFFFIFIFFMQKLFLYQMIAKLEKSAEDLEKMVQIGRSKVVKACVKHGKKKVDSTEYIKNFSEFFIIPPVDVDPYGILKKLEHAVNTSEDRFVEAAEHLVPDADSEVKADINMSLKGVIGINQLAKIVRHAVEMAKKMNNFQLAFMIQMQLPFIEKLAKGELEGTKAFLEQYPIGDAIGPYIIASLSEKKGKIADDMFVSETRLHERRIILVKAIGPGARVGKPGTAIERLLKDNKVSRVITVDAAAKLEGEETGSVAEGVGVAMGGGFHEKAKIEELSTTQGIPMDAIAIKMSMDEAIKPMVLKVVKATPKVMVALETAIRRSPKNSTIIVAGIGNTVGVGNTKGDIKSIEPAIEKKDKEREAKAKKRKWWQKKPVDEDGLEQEIEGVPVARPGVGGTFALTLTYFSMRFSPPQRQLQATESMRHVLG